MGSAHREDDRTTGPAARRPHNGRLPRRPSLPDVPARRIDACLARRRHLHLQLGRSGDGNARYEYDSRDFRVARRIRRQLHPSQLRVADLLRTGQQLGRELMVSASHLASLGAMRDLDETSHFSTRQRRRIVKAEPKTVPLVGIHSQLTRSKALARTDRIHRIASKLSLQRGAKFREEMGNGLFLWMTLERRPQTQNKRKKIKL